MTITSAQMDHVGELALDMAKAYREKLRAQFEGIGPGQRSMTALEHKSWFEMHAEGWMEKGPPIVDPMTGQPMVDPATGQAMHEEKLKHGPNWVLALPYVRGGKQELNRYEETMRKIASGELQEAPDGIPSR